MLARFSLPARPKKAGKSTLPGVTTPERSVEGFRPLGGRVSLSHSPKERKKGRPEGRPQKWRNEVEEEGVVLLAAIFLTAFPALGHRRHPRRSTRLRGTAR